MDLTTDKMILPSRINVPTLHVCGNGFGPISYQFLVFPIFFFYISIMMLSQHLAFDLLHICLVVFILMVKKKKTCLTFNIFMTIDLIDLVRGVAAIICKLDSQIPTQPVGTTIKICRLNPGLCRVVLEMKTLYITQLVNYYLQSQIFSV